MIVIRSLDLGPGNVYVHLEIPMGPFIRET